MELERSKTTETARHQPIPKLGRWLASVVTGHMAYYAVPGNTQAVGAFRKQVTRHWLKTLRRRSQRTTINWTRMGRLSDGSQQSASCTLTRTCA